MLELVAAIAQPVGLAAVFARITRHIEWQRAGDGIGPPPQGTEGFSRPSARRTRRDRQFLRVELFLGVFIGAITLPVRSLPIGKLASGELFGNQKLSRWPRPERKRCGRILLLLAGTLTPVVLPLFHHGQLGRCSLANPPDHGSLRPDIARGMCRSETAIPAGRSGDRFSLARSVIWSGAVGSSGASCPTSCVKAMNRSFVSVDLGGFGWHLGPQMAVEGDRSRSNRRVASMLTKADSSSSIPVTDWRGCSGTARRYRRAG